MESAVVVYDAIGHVELRAFQELPNDLIIAYPERVKIDRVFSPETIPTVSVKKIRLERHSLLNVSGGVTRELTAFWPSPWLDQWGIDEVDKFIKREEIRVGSPSATQPSSGSAHSKESPKGIESYSTMVLD